MAKSYIRKRYEYMATATPAIMGAFFFVSGAGWVYGLNSPQAMIAMPMVGGSLSLFSWFLYELNGLFNIKLPKKIESSQPFFSLNQINDQDFIFRGDELKMEIPKHKFIKFCKIGTKRQDEFYLDSKTLHSPYFSKLSKNTVWSQRVFEKSHFLPEEVWSCKYILWRTGQFIEWNPNNQGKAGLSTSVLYESMINKSERRWNILKHH